MELKYLRGVDLLLLRDNQQKELLDIIVDFYGDFRFVASDGVSDYTLKDCLEELVGRPLGK